MGDPGFTRNTMSAVRWCGSRGEPRSGWRPARYSHARDDDHAVDNAMAILGPDEECSAWLNWLIIRSHNQLTLPAVWRAAEELAKEELMQRETIKGVEARKIIDAA